MVKAVEQFPRLDRIREDDRPSLVIFSCLLRFIQGLSATLVTMLLILTTPNVVEIILNFAAVNYISNLDEGKFSISFAGSFCAVARSHLRDSRLYSSQAGEVRTAPGRGGQEHREKGRPLFPLPQAQLPAIRIFCAPDFHRNACSICRGPVYAA